VDDNDGPSRMECLSENLVVALVDGALDPAERARAHAHLHRCGACRRLVSAVARLSDPGEAGPLLTTPSGGGALAPEETWLPRGTAIDRYVILEQVGAGSAGAVYSAYDPDLDRRVALKLLRPSEPDAGDEARDADEMGAEDERAGRRAALLREARLMARLSHPNVIAVHDVGSAESGVFVAMEFIAGSTLREWLEAEERPWSAISAVFVAAGRGLAAAHRAGLVHRDFKPDNVLIDRDGGVRVTDFGLARFTSLAAEEPRAADADEPRARDADGPRGPDETWAWRLTRTGAVVGTPAYMAPEQFLGRPADAASDQFSFCVALYEAVHGARPFAGGSLDELRGAVLAGRARPIEPRGGGPAGLARVLERGLAVDPAARFPSMDALLDELAGRPRGRRRQIALAAAALAIAGAAAGALWARAPAAPELCTGAPSHLATLWGPARRAAIGSAFAATGAAYAPAAWTRTEQIVDDYARGWVAAHTEACRATRVLGEQSEAAMELRMQCLSGRRRDLGALLDLLASADRVVAERATSAALSLPPTSDCADVEALARPVARPTEPAAAAALAAIEVAIARADALAETRGWREALDAYRPLEAGARALGHAPLLAEVLGEIGNLENATGDPAAAARTLEQAILAAEAGNDDARRARSLILLANVTADPTRLERTGQLLDHAGAIVGRLNDRRLLASLEFSRGKAAEKGAKLEEARRHYARALAEEEAIAPPDVRRVSLRLLELGSLLERMGDYDEARRLLERARDLDERSLGPDHPQTARSYDKLANLANSMARFDEALRLYDRAIEIRVRSLGERHQGTVGSLYFRGMTLVGLGRLDEAEADMTRALAGARGMATPDQQSIALCLEGLGTVAMNRGDGKRAIDLQTQALAIHRGRGDRRNIAPALYSLANTLFEQGELDRALARFEEALSIWSTVLGPEHQHTAYAMLGIGKVHVAAKRWQKAIAPLEKAYRIWGGAKAPWGAHATMTLAEALWGANRRPRALELAREAIAFFRTDKLHATDLASAEKWLAARTAR
jgi:tetratricopeptide (TPR) repeat protein